MTSPKPGSYSIVPLDLPLPCAGCIILDAMMLIMGRIRMGDSLGIDRCCYCCCYVIVVVVDVVAVVAVAVVAVVVAVAVAVVVKRKKIGKW